MTMVKKNWVKRLEGKYFLDLREKEQTKLVEVVLEFKAKELKDKFYLQHLKIKDRGK